METTSFTQTKNGVARIADIGQFQAIEQFTKLLNEAPDTSVLKKTPDGNASTLVISAVESTLDEIYLRQWGTEDVNVQQVANEILVWLTLWVIDPQTKLKITRAGFAAVQITVDAVPEDMKKDKRARNAWALDMQNKKPNACYLAFPKAKSLAIKNAAQSLGVKFGRNLNREVEDTPEDFYTQEFEAREVLDNIEGEINACETFDSLGELYNKYAELHNNTRFKKVFAARKQIIQIKNKK